MEHFIIPFVLGAIAGGSIVGLVYHNNVAAVNAAIAKANATIAGLQAAGAKVATVAQEVAAEVKTV